MTATLRIRTHRLTHLLAAAFALALALAAPLAHAQRALGNSNDIHVILGQPLSTEDSTFGSVVYPVTINNSADRPATVELRTSTDYNWAAQVTTSSIRKAWTVDPNAAIRSHLVLPASGMPSATVTVLIDGVVQPDRISMQGANSRGYSATRFAAPPPNLLLSGDLPRDLQDAFSPPATAAGPPPNAIDLGVTRSQTPASAWPATWLTLTRFAAVVVSRQEALAAPEPTRAMLRDYAFAGGLVLIHNGDQNAVNAIAGENASTPDQSAHAAFIGQHTSTTPHYKTVGLGAVIPFHNDDLRQLANLQNAPATATTATPKPWLADALERLQHAPAWAHTGPDSVRIAERRMPVLPGDQLPAGVLFVTLLVFAVLAGPASIWFFAKTNRRTMILVAIPALGVAFSAGIFALGLFADGVSPVLRSATTAFIDHRTGKAVTITHLGVYAPLAPGRGIRFDSNDELTALPLNEYYWTDAPVDMRLDYSDGLRVTSGLVRSRAPAHMLIRSVENRRERVSIEHNLNDPSPQALNGLGANIEILLYTDQQGRTWRGQNIPPGHRQTLTPQTNPRTAPRGSLVHAIASTPPSRTFRLHRDQSVERVLPSTITNAPGAYVALLDGSPFFQPGLERYRDHFATTLVAGILPNNHANENPNTNPNPEQAGD